MTELSNILNSFNEDEDLSYERITVFWQRADWQPFKGYTLFIAPNSKYRALINDQLEDVAFIISRNRIESANKKAILMLFASFTQVNQD